MYKRETKTLRARYNENDAEQKSRNQYNSERVPLHQWSNNTNCDHSKQISRQILIIRGKQIQMIKIYNSMHKLNIDSAY